MVNRSRLLIGIVVFVGIMLSAPVYARLGDVVASFPAPAPNPTALTWADGNLYCFCNNAPYNIWKVRPANGSVIGSFRFAKTAAETAGLAHDGRYFWAGNDAQNVIYCFEWGGSVVSSFKASWNVGQGLACSDFHLWGTETGGEWSYKLYQMRRDCMVIRYYDLYYDIFDPAWDGEYIWVPDYDDIVESSRVVCYRPSDGGVLDTFPSPAASARGAAYDGEYLWLSTLADNGWLWQIDVHDVAVEPASLGRVKALYH
jgi:hypothetical protein